MDQAGYVKLYRSLQEKGYYKDSEYVHLWIHLLMKASYRPKEYLFNGKIEQLQPGQFITGRNSLAKETGIDRSKVERILNTFKNEQQIEQQTNNKFRIISILKWSEYQICEQQDEQPVSSQRAASEQPVSTNKKEKKGKNKTYTVEFLDFWSAYPKKVGKDDAWKAWIGRDGDRPEIGFVLSALKQQRTSEQWTKDHGQYVPNPATWINRGQWADEIEVKKQQGIW